MKTARNNPELRKLGIKLKTKEEINLWEVIESPEKYVKSERDVIKIKSIEEIIKKTLEHKANEVKSVTSSKDAFALLQKFYVTNKLNRRKEHFVVMYLSHSNEPKKIELITTGGWAHTQIEPKEIFKHALEICATNIILCHNHPANTSEELLRPSTGDKEVTSLIYKICRLMNMSLLDHLILSHDYTTYYSFTDSGVIEEIKF